MLRMKDKEGKKAQMILDISSSDAESETEIAKDFGTVNRTGTGGKDKSRKDNAGWSINKNYAQKYDNWRNLEEMQKLKDRLGVNNINELNEEDSSESSSEEDDWSPEKEKAFLKTLSCLKTKDPKIYGDKFGFFKDVDGTSENPGSQEIKKKKGDNRPFTVRDHERKMVLEKGGQISDDDEGNVNGSENPKSYPEELASIKTAFSKALKEIDSSDEEAEDSLLGNKLLKRRANKSAEETAKEQEEYKLWLKGELENVEREKLSKEDKKELKSLRDYWNDDKLDEGEKFLRDYILNKKYIDPTKGDGAYVPSYNEVVHDGDVSDDEKFEAEQEEFEHKYNFRFEEPDQDFIKRYPRTIQDSMRREDSKRKEQRQKVKERKDDVKARKQEEVQRLKALKRKEIMSKIEKLQNITGDPNLNLSEVDIDGDFDPEEYDRRMQQIFNEDYYHEDADEEKPVFTYDKEIDDEDENWDKWVPVRVKATSDDGQGSQEADDSDSGEETHDNIKEDVEFFGKSSSIEKELIDASRGKRKRKRSAFLDALEREKPKFDPKVHKSFEKYFEEYYQLDFEDIVGDVKCRFKYHKTTANDFGLTTEEILKAEDKELNQWASLKKTYQYRNDDEEEYEVKAYLKKAEKENLKKQVLPSMYQPVPNNATSDNDDDDVEDRTQKKRKKKKKKTKGSKQEEPTVKVETQETQDEVQNKDKKKQEKKKEREKEPKLSPQESLHVIKTENVPLGKDFSGNHKSQKQKSSAPSKTIVSPSVPTLSKRQRKNRKKVKSHSENGDGTNTAPPENKPPVPNGKSAKKRYFEGKNKGIKRKAESSDTAASLDEDRLRSYGLNPKKLKKQMKYGGAARKQ